MIYICHRGKKNETEPENEISNIVQNIQLGYDCEIDIWKIENKLYLGHDFAKDEIDVSFLLANSNKLWCHAKNIEALQYLLEFKDINCFWHQDDYYTLTSKQFIWVYPDRKLVENSIAVMPENTNYSTKELQTCYAICTDKVEHYFELLNK